MSKTSKNTSLGVITGVFIFFLVLLGFWGCFGDVFFIVPAV